MKPTKDPLGVSPSDGNQGTTRDKGKIILTSVGIEPTTSGLGLPLPCQHSTLIYTLELILFPSIVKTRLVVLIVAAFCQVRLRDDSFHNLSVSVAYPYTKDYKSLLLQLFKYSIKESSFSELFLLLFLFSKPGSNYDEFQKSFPHQWALTFSLKWCALLLKHIMLTAGLILFLLFC